MTEKVKAKDCKKLDDCYKIKIILDKDLLEFQYQDAIRAVCAKCSELEKGTNSLDKGGQKRG